MIPSRFVIGAARGVDRQAHQLLLQVQVGQRVVVVQVPHPLVQLHLDMVLRHLGDPAQRQAGVFGGVEGADVVQPAVDEVVRAAAVEVAVRVGCEAVAAAAGRATGQLRPGVQQLVQQQPVKY